MPRSEWESSCHHTDVCALTGSAAFFASIPGSFILINGPLWCYFYSMRFVDEVDNQAPGKFYCSQPGQNALVYGTEADILAGLAYVRDNFQPERVFLQNNCSVSLIGDDLQGIADKSGMPWPVYALDSGGLHGGFAGGYQKGIARVIREMKPLEKKPRSVNVLGLSSSLMKGKEDAAEIRRLLELLGVSVVTVPGAGDTWESIMQAPSGAMNIVVRDELGLSAARQMEEQFGIPYMSIGMPYGISGTIQWTGQVANKFSCSDQAVREEAAARKNRIDSFENNMQSLWGPVWFDQVLMAGMPSDVFSMAEALRSEWADTGRLVIHAIEMTSGQCGAADDIRVVRQDDRLIKQDFETWEGGLLMGSIHESQRLLRLKKDFVSVNINRPYYDEMILSDVPMVGLRGAEYMMERIWDAYIRATHRQAIWQT
ncbi:MAG: nitrogenase component 1 [Dialister sp.]|nr:nitrogenase component 1 [Dialister sp.]